jgi:hypothetical protein
MIARLLEVAGHYKPKPVDDKTIVDISFNNTIADAKGTLLPTVQGYPGGIPIFEQIDGRGALRVNVNQGISYVVGSGKPRLLNTPNWRVEFQVRMVNPGIFKHEPLIVLRTAGQSPGYNFYFWKRAQSANKVIVTGELKKGETDPLFIETTAMVANTWRTYAIERTAVDNTIRFYVDGVQKGTRVSSVDLSSDVLEVLQAAAPNFFNGWIRDLKVFR